MSAEDFEIVREALINLRTFVETVRPDTTPAACNQAVATARVALVHLDRLAARLQEAEKRSNLFHNLDLEARAHAAEAREAALREALETKAAFWEANAANFSHGADAVMLECAKDVRTALAADPESEEAPE